MPASEPTSRAPALGTLLAGRVAFVTGAARGIGLSIATRFAEQGAAVVLGDVDGPALAGAVANLARRGLPASAVTVDVTSAASVAAARQACLDRHDRVDVVVANAGILYLGHAVTTPEDRWRRVLDVNLTGAFLTCQVFGQRLIEQGTGGSIVLTSSLFGVRGGVENSAYAASKFGMIGLMQCLAAELAPHGILVNAVCPGQVDTDMLRALFRDRAEIQGSTAGQVRSQLEGRIPLGRLADPSDIADVYVFLASPLNRYVTGQSIVVDGGWNVSSG